MSHTDPIIKLFQDAMGDRTALTPEQRAEREAQDAYARGKVRADLPTAMRTLQDLFDLIEGGQASCAEATDYLANIWESGVNTGREMELIHHRWSLRKLGGFVDNGDATAGTLPLVKHGPGGSYTQEYHG